MIVLVHDRWILLEQMVALAAPWHIRTGKVRFPHRNLWTSRDDVQNIHSVTIQYDQNNVPSFITGKEAATGKEVKLDFSFSENTGQVIMLYDGVEEGRMTEEIIPASRTIKFNLTHPTDSSLNIELNVSSPVDDVHLGKSEFSVQIKIGADTYTHDALYGGSSEPQTVIDYNNHLIRHAELGRAQVAALHEAMFGPLVVDAWEGLHPTVAIFTDWQMPLCLLGSAAADYFGLLITGGYAGLNWYLWKMGHPD